MRFPCKGVVATTHLALGVITILLMFGPAVEAQAQVPDRPDLYTVHSGHRYLTVSVESRDSVVPPTSFKLQWKSGNQDYDTSRQKINSVTLNDNAVRTTFWLLGLTNGVEYTFRAFATNEHGDSPPSSQRTGTPFYAPDKDASLWSLRYYYDSEYKGDFLQPQVLGEAQERVHSVVVRPSTKSITILTLPQYQGESNRPGAGCVSKVVEIGFGASPSGLSLAAVRPRGQGFRRRLADRGFPIHRLCASGFGRKRGAPRGASALFRDTAARSVF